MDLATAAQAIEVSARSFRANNFVERSAELRIPVADEEPDAGGAIIEVHGEVPGLLGDQAESGWAVDGLTKIRRLPSSMNTRR